MSRLLALFVMIGLLNGALSAAEPAKKAKKPPRGPDVLVVSDVLAKKGEFTPPTAEQPAYYFLLGSIERDLGSSVAGEKMPDKPTLEQKVTDILATQHYLRTTVGGPMPSLALIISFGTANPLINEWEEYDSETGTSTTQSVLMNQREIAMLVGAYKTRNRLMSSSQADEINSAAQDDRVYVFVGALDVQALRQKQKKLIWRTRMSIPSIRTNLPASLEVMLASAAPHFGRDTELPVFVDDVDRRKAEVIMGPAEVIGFEDAPEKKRK